MATKKKKKHQFPTAYTVIIIVLLLVQLLTFVIPAGNYATIAYDTSNKDFVVTRPSGKKYKEPATQATLKKPNLWQAINQFFTSQVQGIAQSVDIIAFVLILSGCIVGVHANGAIKLGDAGFI